MTDLGFRLSPQQRRLWKLQEAGRPSPYRVGCAVELTGELETATLRAAVAAVVGRHEILRTVFRLLPDVDLPVQAVLPPGGDLLRETDLTGLDPAEQERRIGGLLDAMAWTPAALAAEPPLRLDLARLAPARAVLVIGLPALCADGAGLQNLVREIAAAYAAGGTVPDEPPVQYADLAEWLNSMLEREDTKDERERWRCFDPAALDASRLPFERQAPGEAFAVSAVAIPMPRGDAWGERLAARAAERGTAVPMFLLAAWSALLSRWTDRSEIVVGTLFEGRSYEGLEEAVGTLARFLPLGVRIEPEEPFAALLDRLDAAVRDAHERQEYFSWEEPGFLPFAFELEDLFEEPRPQPAGAVTFSPLPAHSLSCVDRFRLKLCGRAARLELQYDPAAFAQPDVERLAGQFATLLSAALDAPGSPIARLDIVPAAERSRLLELDADAGPPARGCVHHLFAEQARRVPDAIAAVCRESSLTYAELEERANGLAHTLLRLGVAPGARVACCMPRCLEVLVGLLGTLKAGAAFVPLDPQQPAERLALMLEDLDPPVLLTTAGLAVSLPATAAQVLRLDADGEEIAAGSGAPPEALASDAGLAYVIFTSGSTGRPKGVAVEHRQLFNYVAGVTARLELPAGASFATVSTFAADLGHTMIFPSLCTGGTLLVIEEEALTDPEALAEAFARRPVDCLKIVPSHLASLLAAASRPERLLPRLRLVLGGEACGPGLIAALRRLAPPSCRIFNHYGPTETTVGVLTYPVPAEGELPGALPLGRPLPGTRVYVTDPHQRLVPFRMAGELRIGGASVSRGYLGRPDATAERFLPDPWDGAPGARLYRTGDLARRRPDGTVEFLGRCDDQVKLRGFRVEPGEIAAQLLAHPAVRQAAVVLREGEADSEPRLVAYWVPARGADAEPGELKSFLAARLPAVMVPSFFVSLGELPLTGNGKLDRKALPAPEQQLPEEGRLAPRTPVEEVLAGIWAELLGREHIAATDSFFDLGGHSLLATRVMSRLRRVFGVEMPLHDLFNAPVLADLAARVEAALRAGVAPLTPPLIPVPRHGALPLSFAQQRLWFLDQLTPGSALYNIPVALRIAGPLDPGVLELTLGEVVRRHEALRTVFAVQEGSPVQVIRPAAPFGLPRVDLSGLPESAREALVLTLTGEEAGRPFDLARGPLLRGVLLLLAEEDHAAALTMHHIASDRWSMGVLVREVAALYAAFAAGRPSPLPELAVQYADFAAWQSSWLEGEVLAGELAYWRRQLAGLPPLLELPTDRPRPAVQSFRGASRPVRLPAGLTRQAQALGRREGATLFMVLLAGFQALLARYSGQQDLAVGSPVAGRNRVEIEGLIGFFVNTLVLRGDLTGRLTPSCELLGRVRETALAAYLHQDVPFEKLVEELAPERSLAHAPLFQAMFVLQNAPFEDLEIRDLHLRPVSGTGTLAKFDLSLALAEHEGGLIGTADHATDLFDAATIDRLIGHYERLLAGMVEAPERPVGELGLLTPEEALQLRAWNETAAAYPFDRPLHAWIEDQVDRAPSAVAVLFEGEELSYQELDHRANRLARRLRALAVGPEVRVAVCLERSVELVVALLAVLKAGGAYVPLDPEYPRERLAFMLTDSRPAVLLSSEPLRDRLPEPEVPVVWLDAEAGALESESGDRLPGGFADDLQLAYTIYTSGSTGRPKGAMVSHRSICNRLLWMQDAYRLTAADTVLQKTPFSFDVSVWEFFWPLLAGARLAVARPGGHRDGAYLVDVIAREKVTVLHFVPSMLQAFLDEPDLDRCRSLRKVVVSGEALGAPLAERLFARLPVDLENLYGPTEAAVDVTVWGCRPDSVRVPVPIGRPIANTAIHVLDPGGRPAPVGVPGELHIGGVNVGRGYLERPDLTAERFVPDPFGEPGARLYRTGDLARFAADGAVEFLGRLDHQVKIRGFRIELGEIEAALAEQAGVREAAVLAHEDRLVAYVAGDAAVDALGPALSERLPDYMVPATFVKLAALPLNANGKVDRKALPAPERQTSAEAYRAPRTPVEEVLAGIWAELLRLERVGANDHFFDLGGHSLLATRVMSRLRSALGVEMPLRDLFEAPRLADLAARVEAARRAGAGPVGPPLVRVPRQGPLPLSFSQQRLWFLDRLEPGSPLYNVPVALRVEGPLRSEVLALCLGEIVRRHEALRTVFATTEGSPVQVIRPAAPFRLPVVDLSGLPESAREALALALAREEAARPFHLARGPLLRALVLRLAGEDHFVALAVHHIVSDGWSMGILVGETAALYAAFAAGRPSLLPELAVQYADFAAWQSSWLQGEVLEGEISFWRRQLAGLPPLLELPTDRPRPAVQSFRGTSRPVRLPAGLTRQIEALSRREGATLFMVLLAGFQALLARYSGQQDLAVGSPVAGRNRMEIEGLIGFFVNTLVLRGDLAGLPSFRALLGRVRETALAAYLHQDLPFEKLVQELAPERSVAHAPLFQVMLVLQNAPVESLEIRDLRLRPVRVAGTTSKLDLTVSLGESDDGLAGTVEHSSDLFDATTVERLLAGFERLLSGAMTDPDRAVADLPLLAPAEVHQLRIEQSPLPEGVPAEPVPSILAMFERWVDRMPDAIAVLAPDEVLTFAELDRRSNRLARRLRRLGATIETRVGLCAERSPEMVVAVLGVLKSGAAYVPLDPTYPRERLAFMIEDSRVEVLLAQERLLGSLPENGAALTLLLDAGASDLDRESEERLPDVTTPESLAYVIYTSGSTGRPKGVMIHHRSVSNLPLTQQRYFRVRPGTRVLQFASLSFDSSVWEITKTFGSGATLVLGPPERRLSAAEMTALLEQCTIATLPPTSLAILEPEALPGLETLIVAGEACPLELARRWSVGRRFFNGYGPTEATVCASAKLYDGGERLSAGHPFAHVEIWVLDARGNPVPIGVAGELCLGGTGLARGYLHRPDLTAQSFAPHPFSARPGERLYRTGDLAIRRPDGEIELLGRTDDQVKLRGFRIDLGEIEAALSTLDGVREAAVAAREVRTEWGSGDRRLVAYIVGDAAAEALRRSLQERLPDYMVPAAFVTLPALPLTPNGKVDRKALPAPEPQIREEAFLAPRTPLEKIIAGIWCEVLGVPRVGYEDNFFDLGGHSLLLPRVQDRLQAQVGREVSMVELLTHTTVRALARHLEPGETAPVFAAERVSGTRTPGGGAIAIVGLSGRFPGAADVEQLWANLCAGVSSIVRFSDEELAAAGVDPALRRDPRYVPAGGALDGVELFDAEFFGYSPREAEILNPQHRIFLECSWEALEDAGYDSRRVPGPVGMFAGLGFNTYLHQVFTGLDRKRGSAQHLLLGNDKDFLPTRVSYKLDLKGPSMAVQTACSSSLVAVHLACQNLLLGACDMALAGGVSIALPQRAGYLYEEGGINSPDGCCRAFDAEARGTVRGSGVGIVVLKRLEDALAHGDTIRAVIRGSAVNNDGGSGKAGYTAPSVAGQAEVVTMALAAAGVDPATVSYVEAHGTGTILGDPIEIEALAQAFRRGGTRERSCALGSVKSNLGHLDAAAGVTGLIKATLALQHGVLPPSLGFTRPNPQIDFAAGPFHVQTELADWERGSSPRRAGVSSLGIGGTNAHAVLEEAPEAEPSGPSRPLQLLLLSARTAGDLDEATARLAAWLERHPEVPLADVAHTLRVGRHPFEHRRMLVCASREDALAALASRDPERLLSRRRESDPPVLAWLLPGQGSQHPGMGRDLYETEPVFRREIDAYAGILAPRLGRDLREILFSSPGEEIAETRFAQPALFAVEHALARLWLSWDLRPQALLGHSLGEYVAACLAGVLSVDDALALVAARGELMQELPAGAMLSVDLPEAETLAEIAAAPGLSLAAVNGPGQCVVSGPAAEIAALSERLARLSVPCRRLHTSHAFHSGMMEPVLDRFAGIVSRVELRPPSLPYISNLTGTWVTAAEATDPLYWARHLREPVRFGDGVSHLLAELPPGSVLLEAGPGKALGRLVRGRAAGRTVLASMPHPGSPESGVAALLDTVGRLWLAGVEIDWKAFQGEERRRRIPLPTYPFKRQRFWIEAPRQNLAAGPAPGEAVRLRNPENAEVLRRLLAEEPDLRALLPLPAEAGTAPEPGVPAAPSEPASGHRRPELATPYQEPQSELERRLAKIWEDLLGIDPVGVHDDFFELGGHSLLATRLLSRIREDLGRELPLETIFTAPTVSRLSAHLAASGEPPATQLSPISPVPRDGALPLSFAQQRLLFLAVMAPGDPSYNLPLGLRLDGRLDARAVRLAFEAIVARHEPLRTTFRIEESQVTQVIAPTARLPLPLVDLEALPADLAEAEARGLALEQARHPFDLLRGPVMTALLVRLSPAAHLLLLTVHHIAADGWSFAILYRDMTELYRAIVEGRQPLLPELRVQYADFAAWQRAALQEEALERHLDYWRRHLAGARALPLLTDQPRPLRPSGRGATLPIALPAGAVAAARRLTREEDATLFMVLLAAFAVILHRASGCDDLVIGTDIANRNRLETEELVGLFVNQLVLRNDLSGNPTFRELLRRVRRTTLNAYAHQDAPFDRLVEALNPVRDLGTTPLFQVKLVLQNARMPVHELTELKVSPLGVHNQTAKFDLLLNLAETGDTVSGALEYNTDLWNEASMGRLLGDFATAMAAGTARPDERLSRIEEDLSRPSSQPGEERRTILRRRAIPVSLE
ncbi:MAG TPA: amino acid adenylation domain-containing protein [Thermoanaerobaculia bacterium]|nr:amino acid adenylation domain-containing protein [Thermoanaerobaculia bacterium]